MARLSPCPSCQVHVLVAERSCPHCGVGLRVSAGRGAAVLMGLTLAGCPSGSPGPSNPPEPEYGVPDVGVVEPGPDGSIDDPGAKPDEPIYDVAEPEYGVPDSGEPINEPEYGVPDSG